MTVDPGLIGVLAVICGVFGYFIRQDMHHKTMQKSADEILDEVKLIRENSMTHAMKDVQDHTHVGAKIDKLIVKIDELRSHIK